MDTPTDENTNIRVHIAQVKKEGFDKGSSQKGNFFIKGKGMLRCEGLDSSPQSFIGNGTFVLKGSFKSKDDNVVTKGSSCSCTETEGKGSKCTKTKEHQGSKWRRQQVAKAASGKGSKRHIKKRSLELDDKAEGKGKGKGKGDDSFSSFNEGKCKGKKMHTEELDDNAEGKGKGKKRHIEKQLDDNAKGKGKGKKKHIELDDYATLAKGKSNIKGKWHKLYKGKKGDDDDDASFMSKDSNDDSDHSDEVRDCDEPDHEPPMSRLRTIYTSQVS